MRIKKINGKLYKVEVEEPLNDKYKLQDFLDYLQEFGLEDKFNRCKTEDERYDIYALYTRVRLSKVHPPEYFNKEEGKKEEKDIDSGVYSCKPNNKDNATFARKRPKKKPQEQPKQEQPKENNKPNESYKIKIENDMLLESCDIGKILMGVQRLPRAIIEILKNKGYKIRAVSSEELSRGLNFAGQWNSNRIIKIAFDCPNDKYDVLLHELGHMIDYERQGRFISNSAEFIRIYNKEKVHFVYQSPNIYEYHKKDPQEFFAESFREYITEPYNLKALAPKTYEFIKNYILTL